MKLNFFTIPLAFSILFSINANSQNMKVIVGQNNQLQVKLENQKAEKCNIDVAFPNGSTAQYEVSKPDYIANIPFNPTVEGQNVITWQGNLRRRGLSSLTGCEGGGKISVYATPNNEVKTQRWNEIANKVSEKQKICITTGLKAINVNLELKTITGEINIDANEPPAVDIRNKCSKFADNNLIKNQICNIENRKATCDELYETTLNGEKKQFTEDQLLNYLFNKEPIITVSVETPESIAKFEAYKKTPAYKKEQTELAKKLAIEEAKAKKEEAEQERLKQKQEEQRLIAEKKAADEKLRELASKNFRTVVICDTSSIASEYGHKDMATSYIRLFASGATESFGYQITKDRYCRMDNTPVNNYELLMNNGKVVYRKDGNQFVVLQITKFSTAGIVGKE